MAGFISLLLALFGFGLLLNSRFNDHELIVFIAMTLMLGGYIHYRMRNYKYFSLLFLPPSLINVWVDFFISYALGAILAAIITLLTLYAPGILDSTPPPPEVIKIQPMEGQ